jgi:hypothetical protein
VYRAGRATAMRMFEHLGLDFDRLVGNGAGKSAGKTTTIGPAEVKDAAQADSVTLYGPANEDLLVIRSLEREGNSLVVKGQAYGTMPLSAALRPEEARRLFKLVKWPLVPFLVSFLFRRSRED